MIKDQGQTQQLNWTLITLSHDNARTDKEGMRIGKTPKKLDCICCPQCRESKADTLKLLRTMGEGDQELEKRLVQVELT
jgi:hypothetical protein